jgi:acyl carrier protein
MEIIGIFAECLEIPEDEITPDSRFKELKNWDSLIHVQIIAEIEELYSISLPIERLTEINTVRELIAEAEKAMKPGAAPRTDAIE